jgi:hypothetical protein
MIRLSTGVLSTPPSPAVLRGAMLAENPASKALQLRDPENLFLKLPNFASARLTSFGVRFAPMAAVRSARRNSGKQTCVGGGTVATDT